jgi:cobalt-precorrin 5A hydrolase/precorrin-3B C17-methyltransferase
MKPAILTFAASSAATAERIAGLTGGEVYACGPGRAEAKPLLARLFRENTPIIGVCAAGILIRLLAPLLGDKHAEPAVLAVSQDGAHIVPLLGGHHGANRLAREIAAGLGGVAALTTASDSQFARGLDEPPTGWVLEDPDSARPAMAAVLAGASIALEGHAPWLAEAGYPMASDGTLRVAAGAPT